MVDLAYFLVSPKFYDKGIYYEDDQNATFRKRYEEKALRVYYRELTAANPSIESTYSFE